MSSDFVPTGQHSAAGLDDLVSHHHHHHQPPPPPAPHHPQPLPSPSTPTNNVLAPSWRGIVMTTMDALKIIEACLDGTLCHTARRPHDRERDQLIQSGNVFVYEESSSGIKRWTDGQNWSPSRILGNFLIYRELDKNFPPGDKKRAIKRKREGKPELQNGHSNVPGTPTSVNDDRQRALLGSLIDSYPFKDGGLIKKTISVKWNQVTHHLVSYYSLDDANHNRLTTPQFDHKLANIRPRADMIALQDFRVPVEQEDPAWVQDRFTLQMGVIPSHYNPTQPLERTMSMPQIPTMIPGPYGNPNQFHMPVPMHQPINYGMSMGSHFAQSASSFVDQRPRQHSLQLHASFGPNYSHIMDGPNKRRRSLQHDPADDTSSPIGNYGSDLTRSNQHYFPVTSSYPMPTLPSTTMSPHDYKPAVTSMDPPPVTTMADISGTSLSFVPPTSAEFAPAVTTLASAPVSALAHGLPRTSLTSMPSLTGSSLDGPNRDPTHYYGSFNTGSWSSSPHDNSSSYMSASSRSMNGWHNASPAGGHH